MLRNSNIHNHNQTSSQSDDVDLPDEATLKNVAEALLNKLPSSKSGGKAKVSNVKNVSGIKHPSIRNATVVTFSVICDPASASEHQGPVSILMKRGDDPSKESNEIQAYSTLFRDFQSGRASSPTGNIYNMPPIQQGNLFSLIPRVYHVDKRYLLLEDLESSSSGFKNLFREGSGGVDPLNLDFNHCLLAVETLARFHAASYLLRRQLGEKGKGKLEMIRRYPFLNHQSSSIYSSRQSPKLSLVFERAFELVCKLVENQNVSLAFNLQRKLLDPSGIFEKVVKLVEEEKHENDDFYVVCHGHFLPESLLFKYGKYNVKEPAECRLTNLGSLYVGPLTSELALFLLTSTNLALRQEFEEKLLAFYCDAFQEQVISSVGMNSEIGKEFQEEGIDEFHRKVEKQYRKMLEFAFYHAMVLLPLIAYRKFVGHSNNNFQRCSSISDLLANYEECFIGEDQVQRKEFEEFAMNEQWLGERFVEILKQLMKARVLL